MSPTNLWRKRRLSAPQQCPKARQQFHQIKGLSHIVIRARIQPFNQQCAFGVGGQEQNGREVSTRSKLLTKLDSIQLRKHNIQHNHVILTSRRMVPTHIAIGG